MGERRVDERRGHGQIAQHLIRHQHRNLAQEAAKADGAAVLVAQVRELVEDQGVFDNAKRGKQGGGHGGGNP